VPPLRSDKRTNLKYARSARLGCWCSKCSTWTEPGCPCRPSYAVGLRWPSCVDEPGRAWLPWSQASSPTSQRLAALRLTNRSELHDYPLPALHWGHRTLCGQHRWRRYKGVSIVLFSFDEPLLAWATLHGSLDKSFLFIRRQVAAACLAARRIPMATAAALRPAQSISSPLKVTKYNARA